MKQRRLHIRARFEVIACMIALVVLCGVASSHGTQESPRLRVLTYNIHHGEGTDGKFDYVRLSKVINDLRPDVVALQEVDCRANRSHGVDQAQLLGELTETNAVFGQTMPFPEGAYGLAVLSRFPIEKADVNPLPFQVGHEPRAAFATRINPDNGLPSFVFVSTHLSHQGADERADQAKQINLLFPAEGGVPHIVAGDLNARVGSDAMNALLKERWVDTVAPRSRIDYVLTRSTDPWKVVEVNVVDNTVASDHKPILVVLEWAGEVKH